MLLQLVRANHPSLTAKLLKSNLLNWNERVANNPLAVDNKLTKELQQSLHIEDGLPWTYQFASNGDPICLNASDLLVLADKIDKILVESGHPHPAIDELLIDPISNTSFAVAERPSGISLKLRDLFTAIEGEPDYLNAPEPFLHIRPEHLREMGIILSLIHANSVSAKDRLTELCAGETTNTKRYQVHLLTEVNELIYGLEIQTLRTIHDIVSRRGDGTFHLNQLPLIGKPPGDYFFLDVDVEF